MYKLIASDLDGTLSDSSRILDFRVKEKIEDLYKNGWIILFNTGRFYKYAEELLSSLTCPYFLAVQNGACLLDPSKSIIDEYSLSKDWLSVLVKETRKFNITWWIESGFSYNDIIFLDNFDFYSTENKEIFLSVINNYFPNEREKKVYIKELKNSLLEYPYDFFSVVKTIGPLSVIRNIADKLNEMFHNACSITSISVPRHLNFGMIHITHKQASKEKVLSRLVNNISSEKDVFTIVAGDDQNDYKMIKNGDFKIVMNTAPEFMLRLADYIAPSAKEQGIIKALEEGEKMYLKQLSRY